MTTSFAFLTNPPVDVEINGETFQFYPLSLGSNHKLKNLAKPLASAISMLMADTTKDTGRRWEEFANKEDAAEGGATLASSKTHIEAITPELAKYRTDQKEKAVEKILDCLTDPALSETVAYIIMDSMRGVFPVALNGHAFTDFKNKLTIQNTIALLKGVVQANASAFDPFLEPLKAAMQKSFQTSSAAPFQDYNTQSQASEEASGRPSLGPKALPKSES